MHQNFFLPQIRKHSIILYLPLTDPKLNPPQPLMIKNYLQTLKSPPKLRRNAKGNVKNSTIQKK